MWIPIANERVVPCWKSAIGASAAEIQRASRSSTHAEAGVGVRRPGAETSISANRHDPAGPSMPEVPVLVARFKIKVSLV